jgi:hypothetical protein
VSRAKPYQRQKTPAKRKAKLNPKSNVPDDFVSVARRLECDEDKWRFEAKLGKIARAKVQEPDKGSRAER